MLKQCTTIFISILLFGQTFNLLAQDSIPSLLKEPANWRYEKIDFPLDFAPDIPYKGFEELRFAPGMFDRQSPTYFSYLFVIAIEEKNAFNKTEIKSFLTKYYRGLCNAVAKGKNISFDTSEIKIKLQKDTLSTQSYNVQLVFLDTFNNGEKVLLNMELEVLEDKNSDTSYLIALVSPKSRQSNIWKEMYTAKQKVLNLIL